MSSAPLMPAVASADKSQMVGPLLSELEAFIEQYADDAADASLLVGVAIIEKACADARAALDYRWRSYPRGELRRLHRQVHRGVRFVTFGVLLSEGERELWDARRPPLPDELEEQARAAGKKARNSSTKPKRSA